MGSPWQLFLIWLLVQTGTTMLNFDKCDETTGSCYALVNEKKSWEEASKHCSGNGGFLAEIKNSSEQSVVRDVVAGVARGFLVWLGGTNLYTSETVLRMQTQIDFLLSNKRCNTSKWHWNHTNAPVGNPNASTVEFGWDGNFSTNYTEGYQYWGFPLEPSNVIDSCWSTNKSENESCMAMYVLKNQSWNDTNCTDELAFVCQALPFEPGMPDMSVEPYKANVTGCENGTLVDGVCNYCSPNQCVGGRCLSKQRDEINSSGFVCLCDKGYAGPLCKLEDDPCINDPSAVCLNGGTCHVKIQPGPNDWICLCPWKPKLGQAKDCSKAGASEYPIDKVVMRVLVTVPYAALAVAWIVIAVVECIEIGELPDLEWASNSSTSDSEDSIECEIDHVSVNNETSGKNDIMSVYSNVSISEINIKEDFEPSLTHAAIGKSKSNISDLKTVTDAQSTLQMNKKPSFLRYEESHLEVFESRSSKFMSPKMLDEKHPTEKDTSGVASISSSAMQNKKGNTKT